MACANRHRARSSQAHQYVAAQLTLESVCGWQCRCIKMIRLNCDGTRSIHTSSWAGGGRPKQQHRRWRSPRTRRPILPSAKVTQWPRWPRSRGCHKVDMEANWEARVGKLEKDGHVILREVTSEDDPDLLETRRTAQRQQSFALSATASLHITELRILPPSLWAGAVLRLTLMLTLPRRPHPVPSPSPSDELSGEFNLTAYDQHGRKDGRAQGQPSQLPALVDVPAGQGGAPKRWAWYIEYMWPRIDKHKKQPLVCVLCEQPLTRGASSTWSLTPTGSWTTAAPGSPRRGRLQPPDVLDQT